MNLAVFSLLLLGQVTATTTQRGRERENMRLLRQSDFKYLGAFRVPQGQHAASSFAYGGTAPAYNPANNSLFLVGHDWQQAIAEIKIPPLVDSSRLSDLKTAPILQDFVEIQSRIPNWTLNGHCKIGGLEVVGKQLIGTFYEFYDADGKAAESHFTLSSLDLSSARVSGLHKVGMRGAGFVAGYMAPIPPPWQDALGAVYLTGQAALPIISRTSAGPAAFGFQPNDLGRKTIGAIEYLSYPLAHPLRPETSSNPVFNLTTEISGVVFPPNTRSVIFFGSHGTGSYAYGEPEACNDPVRPYKGPHAAGGKYVYQAWAYDVADLIRVKNGIKRPWEIQPYDVWTFDLPLPELRKHIGGVTFDAQTGRLYLSQQRAEPTAYDVFPVINVFQIRTPDRSKAPD